MIWTIPLLPFLWGLALWGAPLVVRRWRGDGLGRLALGATATTGSLATAAVALTAAVSGSGPATYLAGPGMELRAELGTPATVVSVLVPLVAAVVIAYAAAHEERRGLHRLVSLLVVFVGAMELVVVAGDIVTLLVGWELVAGLSYGLIAHRWRDADRPAAAAHAFNATRFGALGLFLAAGAGFAQTGSFAFADWTALEGSALHVVTAGLLLAAVSKSGQVPFSPWLFSAMAGPTSVSALLHSSTMVAAGAYALLRLHPILDQAAWFGPTTLVIGLVTALAAGIVGVLQQHAKKLLAASTSAQYGLMLVAIGAGYPEIALGHLVVHALFKAQLFLSAGVAGSAVGSYDLTQMRLGSQLRGTAALTGVAFVSLAAVPPLLGAFTKEEVVTAATHHAVWAGLLVIAAGGLTAAYATRYQLLAFGRDGNDDPTTRDLEHTPGPVERYAMLALAIPLILGSVIWIPGVEHAVSGWLGFEPPESEPWELGLSVGVLLVAAYATSLAHRAGRLASVGGQDRGAADWLGIPAATERLVVRPALALARATATFDDRVIDRVVEGVGSLGRAVAGRLAPFDKRVVDAGVEGAGRLGKRIATLSDRFPERGIDGLVELVATTVDRAAEDVRRMQTGLVHHQYVVIVGGLTIAIVAAVIGR